MEERRALSQAVKKARTWLLEGYEAVEIARQRDELERNKAGGAEGTGEWILYHPAVQQWFLPNKSLTPILWVTGASGLGKSYLCASTANALQGAFRTGGGPANVHVTLRLKDQEKPQTATSLFINLASQLLDGLTWRRQLQMGAQLATAIRCGIESANLGDLIQMALEDIRATSYIFLDGFDEADIVEGQGNPEEPATHVQSFVKFVITLAKAHPSKIRLWYSSQHSAAIEKLLGSNLSHLALTAHDNYQDLARYINGKMGDRPNEVQDEIMQDFTGAVTSLLIGFDDFHVGADDLPERSYNPRRKMFFESRGAFRWAYAILRDWLSTSLQNPRGESETFDTIHFYNKLVTNSPLATGDPTRAPLWRVYLSIFGVAKRPLDFDEIFGLVATIQGRGTRLSDIEYHRIAFHMNDDADISDDDFDLRSMSTSSKVSYEALSDQGNETGNNTPEGSLVLSSSDSGSAEHLGEIHSDSEDVSDEESPLQSRELVNIDGEEELEEAQQEHEVVAICEEQPNDESDSSEGNCCGWGLFD